MVTNLARGQLNRENNVFPACARSRLVILFRETGSAVLSRVSPLIPNTQAESSIINLVLTDGIPPAFRDGVHTSRQPPSGQSRVYWVTQLLTDGFHCRELAGTGSVVLKGVPVTGAAFSGVTIVHFLCASLLPHPLFSTCPHHSNT